MNDLYDPAINAEYMPSQRVPEARAYFDTWARESADVRHRFPPQEMVYGESIHAKLDLFEPEGAARATLLWIHGGYWQAFYKEDFSYVAPPLLRLGLRVAVMSYDLAPAVGLRQIVRQARRAASFVSRHFAGPLYVAGHSAGGHLAAMIHCAEWEAEGVEMPRLSGGIGISGVYDLRPLRHTEVQEALHLSQTEAEALSPALQGVTSPAPFIVAVGENESGAFHAQSQALADAWAGTATPVHVLSGRHHFDAPDDLAELLLLLPK